MKSVLISIHPKWCELIFKILGYDYKQRPYYKKRLELRKSVPKCETPFKAYIYCTLQGSNEFFKELKERFGEYEALSKWNRENWGIRKGKVIGEFTCDYILRHCEMANADIAENQSCVPREDILKYSNGKEVFGLHISDLVLYNKPKKLSEFTGLRKTKFGYEPIEITRPPQSWCYVESEVDTE